MPRCSRLHSSTSCGKKDMNSPRQQSPRVFDSKPNKKSNNTCCLIGFGYFGWNTLKQWWWWCWLVIMIMNDSDANEPRTSWAVLLYGTYHGRKPSQQIVKASRGSGRLNAKFNRNRMSNAMLEVIHFVVYKKSIKVQDRKKPLSNVDCKTFNSFTISWDSQYGLPCRNAQSWYFRIFMAIQPTPP